MSGARALSIRPLFSQMGRWIRVAPNDPEAKFLLQSYRMSWLGQAETVTRPPAAAMTLVTPQSDALCVWRREDSWACRGVRLAVLHNRSRRRVYRLLGEASEHAQALWPEQPQFVLLTRRAQATRTKTLRRAGWTMSPDTAVPGWLWVRQR